MKTTRGWTRIRAVGRTSNATSKATSLWHGALVARSAEHLLAKWQEIAG